jgi:hypothetical protein
MQHPSEQNFQDLHGDEIEVNEVGKPLWGLKAPNFPTPYT